MTLSIFISMAVFLACNMLSQLSQRICCGREIKYLERILALRISWRLNIILLHLILNINVQFFLNFSVVFCHSTLKRADTLAYQWKTESVSSVQEMRLKMNFTFCVIGGPGNSTVVCVSVYQVGGPGLHPARSSCIRRVKFFHCAINSFPPMPTTG